MYEAKGVKSSSKGTSNALEVLTQCNP